MFDRLVGDGHTRRLEADIFNAYWLNVLLIIKKTVIVTTVLHTSEITTMLLITLKDYE